MTGGANHVTLVDGQRNFALYGACEDKVRPHVRGATESDKRDPEWRAIKEGHDKIETQVEDVEYGETYPDDLTSLYYWRPTFWRT